LIEAVFDKYMWHEHPMSIFKKCIEACIAEYPSWDGAMLIALRLIVLFLVSLAKIAADIAIAYGI
jgi:hypothetical protein